MFRYYIDAYDYTNEITEPHKVEQQVSYNKGNFVWTETLPSTFTGIGSLYQMLFARMMAGQFCESMEIEIKKLDNGDYYSIFIGKIMMSDLNWNLTKNEVEISIVNSDWQTRIENNFEVPVPMNARYSKSSSTVNPLPISLAQSTTLQQFIARNKADTLDFSKSNVVAWNVDNILRHVVKYISDSNVGYGSAFLNTNYLPGGCRLWVTSGYNIRVGTNRNIEVTFKQMFTALRKLLNLVMYFTKGENNSRILKIEDAFTVSQASSGILLTDVQNVGISYDQNSYISSVKVGATTSFQNNTEITADFHFPKIEGANFAQESFAVNRECSVNNVLDLTISDFTYDHNRIEDIIVNDNTEYDEDLFFIQVQGNTPYRSDNLGISPTTNSDRKFFNQGLLNNKIIERHDVYGQLIKHHGIGLDTFMAYAGYGDVYSNFTTLTSAAVGAWENIPVTNQNDYTVVTFGSASSSTGFDNNGNYNNAQPNSFVCPSSGLYLFTTWDKFSFNPPSYNNHFHFYGILTVRNSGGTITQQKVFKWHAVKTPSLNSGQYDFIRNVEYVNTTYAGAPEPYTGLDALAIPGNGNVFEYNTYGPQSSGYEIITHAFDFQTDNQLYLDAGDYVNHSIVVVESDGNRINNENGSTGYPSGSGTLIDWKAINFACIWSLNGGNVVINTRDGSGKLRVLTCETFLTDAQIRGVIANSQMKVSVSHEGNNFIGKINNFNVDHKTNICKFDLKLD